MNDKNIKIRKKVNEAMHALQELGLPKNQCNERSAMTLLALLNLKSTTP